MDSTLAIEDGGRLKRHCDFCYEILDKEYEIGCEAACEECEKFLRSKDDDYSSRIKKTSCLGPYHPQEKIK